MSVSLSEPSAGDQPLSAWVRDVLRERIIRGQYAQGTRLPEAKLAADLAVSRVPLRAAIPQLEVDGFVRTLPRRSAIVFEWTHDAVQDLFDVRLAIEAMATGHAARRLTDESQLQPLRDAITESERAIDGGDPYAIAATSTIIHQRIVQLAGNELLTNLMSAVAGRIHWFFYLTSQRDPNIACHEHHELCDVIATGNEELARAVAVAHIERGRPASTAELLDP
jgi:DNA-binding GntR family transcriptional regulator